ncbi:hypothetical protein FIBSPDRAFT_1035521 [Athelia psychrophila]|uniref:Uncharacterized protein n=1 Tax=Athelia psychrophila TaxID=1759441 RepID=A0A166X6K7_9AGAM|nr:hypothetical protein FIBSPDRAFT_1035521 [Fibularhizoctonia sp. CBS 109695]
MAKMMRSNTLRIEPFYSNDFLPLNKSSSSSGLAPSTSAIFPYLRKGESSDAFPSSKQKNPLLTLKLSSPSFLDSTVSDGLSDNALYTVKTTSTCTTVLRNDPWEGTNKVADIRWAKKSAMKGKSRDSLQGSVVEMIGSGRTKPVEQFLKFSALSGARSFLLPSYPHPFKWRRSGPTYHCTTSSIKGPVASMDVAVSTVPPRIRVFETLLVQDTRPQLDRGGVSLNLLDHLLITALLLVTESEEWLTYARPSITVSRAEPTLQPVRSSVRRWRKYVYGDPPFPSLRSPRHRSAEESDPDDDLRPSSPAQRPASMRQLRKIVFGEPMFPSLARPGPDPVDDLEFATRASTPDEYDEDFEVDDHGSLTSDDINDDPETPASTTAPAHGFLDPSFYDSGVPPVPEIPSEYTSSHSPSPDPSIRNLPSTPSTSLTATSTTLVSSKSIRRELPRPPTLLPCNPISAEAGPSWLHRSQSTPFLYGSGSPAPSQLRPPRRPPSSPESYPDAFPDLARSASTRPHRELPQPPTMLTTSASTSQVIRPLRPRVVIRTRSDKRRPAIQPQRSLPEPQLSAQRLLPDTPDQGASTGGRLSAQEQLIQQTMTKEANELADWVGSLAPSGGQPSHSHPVDSAHDVMVAASHQVLCDLPPPAYHAIDFSHPPQASAPPSTPPTPPPPAQLPEHDRYD